MVPLVPQINNQFQYKEEKPGNPAFYHQDFKYQFIMI